MAKINQEATPGGWGGARPARLHGYFRSSASWRVRIALNLKGLAVTHVPHHLRRGGQRAPDYPGLNPQGLVPALELDDGTVPTQSLAIIEWLEETNPVPALLPADPLERARWCWRPTPIPCRTSRC
jgi:maleylpyruvate isomerase